ncbi:hypothetical protein MUS1_03960 [Marinomonas ushuaiensis DSM 15871]|uniref:Uncharacterized protein n=1 Tax=Marinomonas ushuaiensis DSM 15871 TaxID=1122207 RepID=X7E4Y0_9GAMM|nr:hypothetical protein MUS1_03960 [Marinomonas ushuaiensis DSM 15871]
MIMFLSFAVEHEIKSKSSNGLIMVFGCIIRVWKKAFFNGRGLTMRIYRFKYLLVSLIGC